MSVNLANMLAAYGVVRRYAWHTPLLRCPALGDDVYLKMECWQPAGSFKIRGALWRLAGLSAADWARGVVTASAGNHGLGVAHAGRALGLPPVTIFVPENAAANKARRLADLGCDLRQAGADYDAAHAQAVRYAQERGALYLSAYDDPLVIAGQGTAGLEIMHDLPAADLLLVPVGGGGLIAGVAIAAKAANPAVHIVGVQPEASPSAWLSLRDGRPYETYPAGPSICDGLTGGFGRLPFELAGGLIDEVLLISEAAVRRAVAWLLAREQLVVEGSGAIAIAPLLDGQVDARGHSVVAVLTGRNIDADLLATILAEEGPA